MRNVGELSTRSAKLAIRPKQGVRAVLGAASALAETAKPMVDGAPRTPLNTKPGPHRSVAVVTTKLADYKEAKSATGATVNDVVLAAVAGALGKLPHRPRAWTWTASSCVPASRCPSRPEEKKGGHGQRDRHHDGAASRRRLRDGRLRLTFVQEAMKHLKSSKQAEGAKVLTSIENALPPAILARASRLGFSSRLYNLLVTNVPGPQVPIYLLGRQLDEAGALGLPRS